MRLSLYIQSILILYCVAGEGEGFSARDRDGEEQEKPVGGEDEEKMTLSQNS